MTTPKHVGILLETREDAVTTGLDADWIIHWREENEVAAISAAIQSFGYTSEIIGSPYHFLDQYHTLRGRFDMVVNLSVGFMKRYRQAMGPMLLETAGIPYTGADPYTRMTTQNKHLMKAFMDKQRVATPPWVFIDHDNQLDRLEALRWPLIVKPACEGTSVGIYSHSRVTSRAEAKTCIDFILHDLQMPVLVEEFISGRELKVCFIGNRQKRFVGVLEDIKENGESLGDEFLYVHAKKDIVYKKAARDASADEFAVLMHDCSAIYDSFVPLDYGVFDIRVNEHGQHFILEFNADASLHPDRTLPSCCRLQGVTYEEMIHMVLESALARFNWLSRSAGQGGAVRLRSP